MILQKYLDDNALEIKQKWKVKWKNYAFLVKGKNTKSSHPKTCLWLQQDSNTTFTLYTSRK